jgi:glyoxylase I family protein
MNESPTPIAVKGIHHVTLEVANVMIAEAFYASVLGAEPIKRPDLGFVGAWIRIGDTVVHLIQGERATSDHVPKTRGDHLAFAVDDLDAAERWLAEKQIVYLRKTQRTTEIEQIFFVDPDGHTIELNASPKS